MGNCMEKNNNSPETEMTMKKPSDAEEDTRSEKQNMRIKIVLTKEELECLLSELENNRQEKKMKKVEIVLNEIQRKREKEEVVGIVAWKPSLDSIDESAEVSHGMDR
ncbi:hypothetical protein OROHE_013425 [Orobanche hederae]